PERDLVCRAFLEAEKYAQLASDVLGDETPADAPELPVDAVAQQHGAETIVRAPNGVDQTENERKTSDASSVTLLADEDEDVPMLNGDAPPTPPDSPIDDGELVKAQPNHAPPLPPRARRFSTWEEKE
ncbi:ubiquitin-specific protease ubp2, partial [Teratosphaeriaceae sp. CCFEE 6253]